MGFLLKSRFFDQPTRSTQDYHNLKLKFSGIEILTQFKICKAITKKRSITPISQISQKEILEGDRYQCQCCRNRKNLTIDQIIPHSQGEKNYWQPIVIAFFGCNCRKENKTPAQAGKKLRTIPKVSIHPTIAFAEQFWQKRLSFEAVKF